MSRLRFPLLLATACVFWIGAAPWANAQGETQTGGTAAVGTGTGATGAGALNADTAFSAIDRGATVGATAGTGMGFSALSAANGTTTGTRGLGGGIGGLGGGFGGLGGMFGNQGFGGGQTTPPAIRTRLRSAIEVAPTPSGMIQQTANRRFQSAPPRAGIGGVGVTMQGGTAVMTGTVGSVRDRRMSELLLRLEPGVRRIDNQVTVSP